MVRQDLLVKLDRPFGLLRKPFNVREEMMVRPVSSGGLKDLDEASGDLEPNFDNSDLFGDLFASESVDDRDQLAFESL
jgi:hypothetical protein